MHKTRFLPILWLALFVFAAAAGAQTAGPISAKTTGKDPVIIIPGITGSQLINQKTGKTVWFGIRRDKDDDIRLPITSTNFSRNRDGLKATDIIRKIEIKLLPDVEVYQTLIDALVERGYTEGDWHHPKASDVFYIFPYDWRRDNVETAQILMQKMIALKRAVRRPDLKFDIIAHSMGGLIARYIAMYGMADLPREGVAPVPNWTGAAMIRKLMMFGTPNEGSYGAFDSLLNGSPIIAGRKLPLVDDFRPEDVLTTPSAFQLLPHRGETRFLDENLKPVNVDIYDPENWFKYGWGALSDPKYLGKLKDAAKLSLTNPEIKVIELKKDANADDRLTANTTFAQARAFFVAALSRAKRFEMALDVPAAKLPYELYAYGGNCQSTVDGAFLFRDEKKGTWTTVVDAREIKTADGRVIKKEDVKAAIYAPGDGTVTQRSLLATSEMTGKGDGVQIKSLFPLTSSFFSCGSHVQIFLDKPIKDSFLSALIVSGEQKQPQP